MDRNTVFHTTVMMFLITVALQASAQEAQLFEVKFEDVKIDEIAPPELSIYEPTIIEAMQDATTDFLNSVQTRFRGVVNTRYVWYANGVDLHKEMHCLAQNIYYEARGEPIEGKLAIANTTINRVRSFVYPLSICDVVWEPYQFSWTTYHKKKNKPQDPIRWEEAQIIAERALEGGRLDNLEDVTEGATNFHTVKVHPQWQRDPDLERTVKIGHHIFYRPKQILEAGNFEPVVNAGQ